MKNSRKNSWSEYYGDTLQVKQTHNGESLYNTTSDNNFYVFNCYFKGCKESGAIYIERTNKIFTLLEESVFNNCSSTSSGGSVFYNCEQLGQIVQKRTCYYKSLAKDNMAFYHRPKLADSKNYAFDVSIYKCGENESKGSYTFSAVYGEILISNINCTNNKCGSCSSYYSSILANPVICNFSTFRENNQSGSKSFYFNSGSLALHQIFSYCNVIENKCRTTYKQILFCCKYIVDVDHSIFLNNIAPFMFYQETYMAGLTISDSYVDNNSTSSGGYVAFTDLKQNYDFNYFVHFYTENCFIDLKEISIKSKLVYLSKLAKSIASKLISSKK